MSRENEMKERNIFFPRDNDPFIGIQKDSFEFLEFGQQRVCMYICDTDRNSK